MQSTRTFVAIEVGPPAASAVLRLLSKLRECCGGVRWIGPEQLHVTVKFLGEIDNVDLPRVCSVLREACTNIEPFRVVLSGIGTFPKNRPPRVVWVGMSDGVQPLQAIHQQLDERLSELGVPREGRVFTPHITLGRVGRGADSRQLTRVLEESAPQIESEFEIDEVILMASIKERRQTLYEPIDHVELPFHRGSSLL